MAWASEIPFLEREREINFELDVFRTSELIGLINLTVGEDAFIGSEKAAPELDGPAWKEQDSYPLEILEYLDWVGRTSQHVLSFFCMSATIH